MIGSFFDCFQTLSNLLILNLLFPLSQLFGKYSSFRSKMLFTRQFARHAFKQFNRRMGGGPHTYPNQVQSLEPGIPASWTRSNLKTSDQVIIFSCFTLALWGPYFLYIFVTDPKNGIYPYRDQPEGWESNYILEDFKKDD